MAHSHEHENEPDSLEHGSIIAVTQADELWNADCPRIRRNLETIVVVKFARKYDDENTNVFV
jgi:hypothetical protein